MRGDSGFDVLREVRIDGRSRLGWHQSDALGDGPPRWSDRADHGKRLCVAFDHDFGTGLHTLQNVGMSRTASASLMCKGSMAAIIAGPPTPAASPRPDGLSI